MSEKPLEIRTRHVGPWQMNTYALICPTTKESVLIDPGADPNILTEMLHNSTPIAIWLTHTHMDHVGALTDMLDQLQVPLWAHRGAYWQKRDKPQVDHWLSHGDTVQVGEHSLRVYHTPGHIDDQICFYIESDHRIIVGDTIFEGGPGRTWSTEGFQTTLKTLKNVVLPWPDTAYCYPGHGPTFRLGDKRAVIEAFIAKDHGDFYGDATWDM